MKTNHGNVWSEVRNGRMAIGFTKQCIDDTLPECFHVLQADATTVKLRGPMLVLETNDGLLSILSPVAGRIRFFNDRARNFPDKLTEEDVIIEVELPQPAQEVKKAVVKKSSKVTPKIGGGNPFEVGPAQRYENDWFINDDQE